MQNEGPHCQAIIDEVAAAKECELSRSMSNLPELSRRIYAETAEFYSTIRPQMGTLAFGFKILYGPPTMKPPILFVGYQPGGAEEDDKREQAAGSHERWPTTLEYATEDWKLARHMQRMFGIEKLRGCAGLNAIFFRAPSKAGWARIPRRLRSEIESFCLCRAKRLIAAAEPSLVVAIGFDALYLFDRTASTDLINGKNRIITRSGTIEGYRAIGTLHLSGAHISAEDRSAIARRVGLAQ